MSKTILGITGAKIIINGQLTYSDISGTKVKNHGLLMVTGRNAGSNNPK